jgi:hypothetical protein
MLRLTALSLRVFASWRLGVKSRRPRRLANSVAAFGRMPHSKQSGFAENSSRCTDSIVRTLVNAGRAGHSVPAVHLNAKDRRARSDAPYQETIITPPAEVRAQFRRVKPLKEFP